jgi:hypothetical protein
MGIAPHTLGFLSNHIASVGGFAGCRMMELGDQQMYCNPGILEGSPAKAWLESRGVKHTSIDTNGLLGALPLNLAEPIDNPEFVSAFEAVTDFGTSEHVGPDLRHLYNCRANCHKWARTGGLLLFMNPKTGCWPLHGYHYFTAEHYQRLAASCHYRILEITEAPTCLNAVAYEVRAAFVKEEDNAFIPFEAYQAICAGTVFAK